MLDPLRLESADFSKLDGRNSHWIGELLVANDSERCNLLLQELYGKTETWPRLVGALGLAAHRRLPGEIDDKSFLAEFVMRRLRGEMSLDDAEEVRLAVVALGYTDKRAIPYLLEVIGKRPLDFWVHALACEALGRIGDPAAIPKLRESLGERDFYAVDFAFVALLNLGDSRAIPLAIERLDEPSSLLCRLEKVTRQKFGNNREQWRRWWNSVESSWSVPSEYVSPKLRRGSGS